MPLNASFLLYFTVFETSNYFLLKPHCETVWNWIQSTQSHFFLGGGRGNFYTLAEVQGYIKLSLRTQSQDDVSNVTLVVPIFPVSVHFLLFSENRVLGVFCSFFFQLKFHKNVSVLFDVTRIWMMEVKPLHWNGVFRWSQTNTDWLFSDKTTS